MSNADANSPDAVQRVVATPAALALIERLRAQHGALMFHQSGGCCDGSAPMCYPDGELIIGDADVCLGEIGGARFYMTRAQFEYWQHTRLVIDVVAGSGGMFSLEGPTGMRFLTRSELFSDEEAGRLDSTSTSKA
ncbi:acetaldehyde dehydrogenase [Burkholderiaceae bacterium 16]|nr:acetaldehyde dehydrogenase [Burkholderiaceae bacterium 16]